MNSGSSVTDGPVRQTIQLDKEVEISTQCIVSTKKEIAVENNADIGIKQLRDRLLYLECQNKRLKDIVLSHLDLIEQNESVAEKSNQSLKGENETLKSKSIHMEKILSGENERATIQPSPLLPANVTSTIVNSEPNQQVMLNSFKEPLLPPKQPSPFISFNGDVKNKKKNKQDPYRPSRSTVTGVPNLTKNNHNILDTSNINTNLKIENKRTAAKKQSKPKRHKEPLYTSGDLVIKKIQRNKRRTSTSTTANKEVNDAKPLQDSFKANKKSKMTTDEDPYQIGEAETWEQSLEMKFCRVEDSLVLQEDMDLDMMKMDTEIDWRIPEETADASLCDFTFPEPFSFQELFGGDATLLNFEPLDYLNHPMPDKSLTPPHTENLTKCSPPTEDKEEGACGKNKGQGNRGRKRASSTTGIGKLKNAKALHKPREPKPAEAKSSRRRAANRGKRLSPLSGLETKKMTSTGNDSFCFSPFNPIEDMYKYKYPTTEVEDCQLAVAKTHHREIGSFESESIQRFKESVKHFI